MSVHLRSNVFRAQYAFTMGLLDEAIREHLDLKRRRGADPAEIERAEREALGPVRRGPEEPTNLSSEPIVASGEEAAEHGGEGFLADEPTPGRESPGLKEPGLFDEQQSQSTGGVDVDHDNALAPTEEQAALATPDEEPSAPEVSDCVDVSNDEPDASRSKSDPHPGQETAEFDAELEAQLDKPREDVLEETPEFLEDAPDHDRLWFEQRPPRDFDFDG